MEPRLDLETLTWLTLGFGLGLIHAFDADHVMALTVFASKGRGIADGVRAGLRWSLGHAVVVLGAGIALLFVGRQLPPHIATLAERGVGLLMIALGVWVLRECIRGRQHLHFHEHHDLPPHAHWHSHAADAHRHFSEAEAEANAVASTHESFRPASHGHDHGPIFVGGLHGLAGSAPILAVVPIASRSPMLGIAYLAVFAIGVSLAMAAFSGIIGHAAGRLARRNRTVGLFRLRALSATGSIAVGAWMLTLV